jgi:hypothetical protein
MREGAAFLAIVVLGLSAGAVPAAEPPSSGEAPEPVRLYTNADLEQFGPPTAPDAPVDAGIPGDWAFVQAFIDREYARLDVEFDRALARSAAEAAPPASSHYVLPYAGWYGGYYPYSWRGRTPHHGAGTRPEPRSHESRAPMHFRPGPPRMSPGQRPSPQAPHGDRHR